MDKLTQEMAGTPIDKYCLEGAGIRAQFRLAAEGSGVVGTDVSRENRERPES